MATLVLHHLELSRSTRVLWLLEELGVKYELKPYKRTPELFAPEELKAIHPLGKAPIIQDGDITLAESGAIVDYLIHKYGPQFQCSEEHYVDNVYFTHLAESTLGATGTSKFVWSILPSRVPFFIRPIISSIGSTLQRKRYDPELRTIFDIVPVFLADDHLTSADFMIGWFLAASERRLPAPGLGQKTKEYIEKLTARPAFKAAVEKGGEYRF